MKQVIRMVDRIEMLSDKKALVLVFIDPQKVYGYLIILKKLKLKIIRYYTK